MVSHLAKILEIVDKLGAISEEIKESYISALMLSPPPPPSYATLVIALESRKELELTPEFIQGKLTDEYNRRMENNPHSKNQNTDRAYTTKKTITNQDTLIEIINSVRTAEQNSMIPTNAGT